MKTDSDLQRDVLAELRGEPGLDAADVGVTVKDGVVTLTSHVSSYPDKYAAERAARRVAGVKAVANEIDVALPGDRKRTDKDVALAAVHALASNTRVPADRVKVSVSQGWVKLEGEVDWQYQKEAAEEAIRNLPGVVGVSNLIRVKPVVPPQNLETNIRNALRRRWEQDARRVRIEVQGSKIVLRGRVRSGAERREAERIAWSAPGVTEVENQITVSRPVPTWLWVGCILALLAILILMVAWAVLQVPSR